MPVIVPMIAPAAKSENQCIVMETPTPIYNAYRIAVRPSHLCRGNREKTVRAIAKAVVVWEEGQPQKTPPRRKPNWKIWLVSGPIMRGGCGRPVKALYREEINQPMRAAWPMAQPVRPVRAWLKIRPAATRATGRVRGKTCQ